MDDIIKHIVTIGCEDIIRICAMYEVTDWKMVADYNKIKNPNNIKAGDVIYIPTGYDDDEEDDEYEQDYD